LTLRCLLDGLLLPAHLDQGQPPLIAFDGDEAFVMEAIEELAILGGGYGLFSGCAAGDTACADRRSLRLRSAPLYRMPL